MLCSTLLTNPQGPNRHLVHRVRHEATLKIPGQHTPPLSPYLVYSAAISPPTAFFPLNFRGRERGATPSFLNPAPLYPRYVTVKRVSNWGKRLHCCLLRHACIRLRSHCLIYDYIVLCGGGGYIFCQGMRVHMCAPRQNCNISKRYLRVFLNQFHGTN